MTDVWGEIKQCSENVTDYIRCSENEQIKKLNAIEEQLSSKGGPFNGIRGDR